VNDLIVAESHVDVRHVDMLLALLRPSHHVLGLFDQGSFKHGELRPTGHLNKADIEPTNKQLISKVAQPVVPSPYLHVNTRACKRYLLKPQY
jgi:hypothetical protein